MWDVCTMMRYDVELRGRCLVLGELCLAVIGLTLFTAGSLAFASTDAILLVQSLVALGVLGNYLTLVAVGLRRRGENDPVIAVNRGERLAFACLTLVPLAVAVLAFMSMVRSHPAAGAPDSPREPA